MTAMACQADPYFASTRLGKTMQAIEAAQIFHDWAMEQGLMPDGPTVPTVSQPSKLALVQPVTDEAKQILRTKQVQSIAFSEPREEIFVFTKRVAPTSRKQLAILPSAVDSVKIRYRQGVQIPVGGLPSIPFGGPAYVVRTFANGSNVYTCGSSVSVGNSREAGSLGCLVRDELGVLYGLSNNHVTGSCSFAGIDLPILAPGVFDVAPKCLSPFTIGFHSVSLPMVPGSADNIDARTNLDAALFKIADESAVSSYQGDHYDTPAQPGVLSPDLEVEKVGRTTRHTTGRVLGQIHGAHGIQYSAALYGFSGMIYFDPLFAIAGRGELFSDLGDSGSLITAVDTGGNRFAVGIVVGGMNDGSAPGGKLTLAMPLAPILAAFRVSLISGHNV